MVNMATISSRDSRTTRIATLIAVFYLPASLVLVSFPKVGMRPRVDDDSAVLQLPDGGQSFFSTGFVEFRSEGNSGLSIHKQVWIAFVFIAVLGITTLFGFWAWHRLGRISLGRPMNW